MWNKPWSFKESALFGVGLLVVGSLLQFTIGAIDWSLLSAPINVILLVTYLLVLGVFYAMRKHIYFIAWSMTLHAAIPALLCGVAVTLLMGLTGWDEMLSAWPFVLIYIWLMSIVGLIAFDRILRLFRGPQVASSRLATFTSVLNHAGLFMAMVCGTLGNADMQRLHMTVKVGQPEWRAADADRQSLIHELPIAIELHSFTIDEYPPQYTIIDNETGQIIQEASWQIVQDTLFEYAAPRPESDSYVEWRSMGACTASHITATRVASKEADDADSQKVAGWVSCGSFMFPYRALRLDERCSAVMPEREPKRYASEVTVYSDSGEKVDAVIEVNHPLEIEGWKIYQLSYDEALGRWSDTSVFELVRDPWLPWVYAGIYMLLAGALLTFFTNKKS